MKIKFIALLIFLVFQVKADSELLTTKEVFEVMEQLLHSHVDTKQMTNVSLQNAFQKYVEQFDPERAYLLEKEIHSFLQLSQEDSDRLLKAFQKKDLSMFKQLNDDVIQKSIWRARKFRKELIENKNTLIDFVLSATTSEPSSWPTFANTEKELKIRQESQLIDYLKQDAKKYGKRDLKQRMDKLITSYESDVQQVENQYLGVNEEGEPLSQAEKENLFSLHVLKALANNLDAHTKVLNNNEAYEMKVRLEKEYLGIGIKLKKKESKLAISYLIPDAPAEKSGKIKEGDHILKIDGIPVAHESIKNALNLLRTPNEKVTLTLKSPEATEEHVVTLKKQAIPINKGRAEYGYENFANGIIGKISLHSFYQNSHGVSSEKDMADAIEKLEKIGNLRGLILDLRDNTGGFLTQAVKVAGLFISSGVIVISKYSNGEEHIYRDIDGAAHYKGPLVILTSKETASAAEIVAQSLQDYGKAVIVGDEHTYGKGTIQNQTVTSGGSGSSFFKVTVGKYYTVSGQTPQLQGVKADIVVPSVIGNEEVGEEYLDQPIAPDTIPSSYSDPLADVSPQLKPWYMRYYAPKIEHKKLFWQQHLPVLRKNSASRIMHNRSYQELLKEGREFQGPHFTENDPQMEEAVNIVKDMILLESRNH